MQIGDEAPKLLDNLERLTLYQSQRVDDDDTMVRILQRKNLGEDVGQGFFKFLIKSSNETYKLLLELNFYHCAATV